MKGTVFALLSVACAVLVSAQDMPDPESIPGADMAADMANQGQSMVGSAPTPPGADMAMGMAKQGQSMVGKNRRSLDSIIQDQYTF